MDARIFIVIISWRSKFFPHTSCTSRFFPICVIPIWSTLTCMSLLIYFGNKKLQITNYAIFIVIC